MAKKEVKQKRKLPVWAWILIGISVVFVLIITLFLILSSPTLFNFDFSDYFQERDYISNNLSLRQITLDSLVESGINMTQLTNKYGHPCVIIHSENRDINLYCFDEFDLNETNRLMFAIGKKAFDTFPELKSGFLHINVRCLINDEFGALVPEEGSTQVVYKNGEIIYTSNRKIACGNWFSSEDVYIFRNRTWNNS